MTSIVCGDLQKALDQIADENTDQFDPVRFFYIKTLVEKSEGAPEKVANILLKKAGKALNEFQADYKKAKDETGLLAKTLIQQHPGVEERCQLLLTKNDFKGIKKLTLELLHERRKTSIKRLTHVFEQPINDDVDAQKQLSFDEFLLNQEQEAIQSLTEDSTKSEPDSSSQFADLKAHKLFKDSWVKMHSDKLVSQAIQEAPQNAGPLNSHMLAIRSLQAMKELSPEYLNRFVSYMDSLLWLEKSAEQLALNTAKKAKGRSKVKHPK